MYSDPVFNSCVKTARPWYLIVLLERKILNVLRIYCSNVAFRLISVCLQYVLCFQCLSVKEKCHSQNEGKKVNGSSNMVGPHNVWKRKAISILKLWTKTQKKLICLQYGSLNIWNRIYPNAILNKNNLQHAVIFLAKEKRKTFSKHL